MVRYVEVDTNFLDAPQENQKIRIKIEEFMKKCVLIEIIREL